MPTLNVVQCANVHHKILCLEEAVEAVRRARIGNEERNGRKVSIRAVITDPCTCHIDALIWLASDIVSNVLPTPQNFGAATMRGFERVSYNAMH